MKSLSHLTTPLFAALSLAAFPTFSHAATSDPVGAMTVTVLNNSDTTLSLPFHKAPVYQGSITSVSAVSLTDSGASFSNDSFTSHYVLLTSGSLEGLVVSILSNTSDTLTLDSRIEDFSLVSIGTTYQIIPYTTLSDVLPNTGPNGIYLFTYNAGSGVNRSASKVYQHFTGYGWYDGGTLSDGVAIAPGESVVVRNQSGSDFDLTLFGSVPMNVSRTYIETLEASLDQDNRIGLSLPVDVALSDLNLGFNGDYLLVFDNQTAAINKSASRVFQYFDGFGWYEGGTRVDDPSVPSNLFYLKASEGYVYRKNGESSPAFYEWSFLPIYLNN